MKISFDHIAGFGKVSDQDFIYSQPHGVLEPGETPEEALEQGWIPWGGYWYNIRSVRIDLKEYRPSKTTAKLARQIDFSVHPFSDQFIYRDLYEKYCRHHGFERTITWDEFFTHQVINYYQQQKLIAYSTIEQYDNALVATQFVWDYADPKLSMGKVAQLYECEVAKMLGCTHVYILGGYEQCCLYKSDFHGFEWWTGKAWSRDKDLYQQLCLRDEKAIVSYDDV